MKPRDNEKQAAVKRNRRMVIVGIVFSICYLVVGIKAAYLQVFAGDALSARAVSEYRRDFESIGKRGNIYDAKARELAVTANVVSIGARPSRMKDPAKAAEIISRVLGIEKNRVRQLLASDKPFVWIKRDASPNQAEVLSAAIPKGLDFIDNYSRIYPNRQLAAQVLGFAGVDGNGLEGIEFYYDEYLRGNTYRQTVVRDALGRIFQQEEARSPDTEGKHLVLTLDANIQNITEQAITRAVRRHNARSAIAVVMVPHTGEIRAIANYPTFNPNSFNSFPQSTWRNRALTDPFEPGSTLKIFTAAAAMESGIDPNHLYVDCENGRYRIGRNVVHDTQPHDLLNLHEIIQYSSNIGTVKISEMIGPEALYSTLRRFGFSRRSGIDCPGEAVGILRPYQSWRKIDHATIAFGQGVSVSAIQLVNGVAAIANDGVLMKPRIVKEIQNPDGSVFRQFEPEVLRRAVTAEIAGHLKIMMNAATHREGTGSQAVPEGYDVCGKTGTAQILNASGNYRNSDYYALFVGFSPAESPELAVLVAIEAPRGKYYGGEVAAPVFQEIMRESLNYMNVKPSGSLPIFAIEDVKPA